MTSAWKIHGKCRHITKKIKPVLMGDYTIAQKISLLLPASLHSLNTPIISFYHNKQTVFSPISNPQSLR